MSTRSVFGFEQFGQTHYVYVHSDGYPTGAAEKLRATLESGKTWEPGRFEADEWGAGFIAANKAGSGGVRLAKNLSQHQDTEYFYKVWASDDPMKPGPLLLTAYTMAGGKKKRNFFLGTLDRFINEAEQIQKELGG